MMSEKTTQCHPRGTGSEAVDILKEVHDMKRSEQAALFSMPN